MIKKITAPPSLFEKYHELLEESEYIEDPSYSRSIRSHVCMTCSKFNYSSQASLGSILSCGLHQKLIWHGQHLTHSCEFYQTNMNYVIDKELNPKYKAA